MTTDAPEVRFKYSQDADILFISLGSSEPSYSEEVDDLLLVERGLFTNEITGFRVLGVKHHRIGNVKVQTIIAQVLRDEPNRLEQLYRQRKSTQSHLPEVISEQLRKAHSLSDFATV